jgi:hypothetical protein
MVRRQDSAHPLPGDRRSQRRWRRAHTHHGNRAHLTRDGPCVFRIQTAHPPASQPQTCAEVDRPSAQRRLLPHGCGPGLLHLVLSLSQRRRYRRRSHNHARDHHRRQAGHGRPHTARADAQARHSSAEPDCSTRSKSTSSSTPAAACTPTQPVPTTRPESALRSTSSPARSLLPRHWTSPPPASRPSRATATSTKLPTHPP